MKKILVVDDQEYVRSLLEDILDEWGYRVESARDGEEAIRKLSVSDWDLVISDMDMPRLGGLGLLERVKGRHAKVPVVLMTGSGKKGREQHARTNGAAGFLPKPFRFDRMEELINNIFTERETVRS